MGLNLKKVRCNWITIIYICIISAFVVYCSPVLSKSLWTDEALSVHDFAMNGVKGVFTTPYVATSHPFYSFLEAIIVKVFSFSEIAVRMPATICGMIFLLVLFYYNRKYFGNVVAFGVGMLMLFNDNFVSLLFQARGYTIVYLCTILAVFNCYQWLEDKNRKSGLVFCISTTIGIWTWPLFCVMVGCLLLFALYVADRERKREVIVVGGITVLLSVLFYLPMLRSMLVFFSQGMEVFGDKLSYNSFYNYNFLALLDSIGIEEKDYLSGTFLLVCWLGGIYILSKDLWKISKYLIVSLFGYSAMVMVLQLNTNPRYFVFCDSITLIFIVYGLKEIFIRKKLAIRICIGAGIILLMTDICSIEHRISRRNKRIYPIEAYKETVEYIKDSIEKNTEIIQKPRIIICSERSYGFEFYFEINDEENYEVISDKDNDEIMSLLEEINSTEKVIFVDHILFREEMAEFKQKLEPVFWQIQNSRGAIKVYEFEVGEVGEIVDL